MNYVAHDCRNSRLPETILDKVVNGKKIYKPNPDYCENRWIDEDITKVNVLVPTWKYCKECCDKLGIDFYNQKPSDYRSERQNEILSNFHKKKK